MAGELTEKGWRQELRALCPLVQNLRLMVGAARHSFNRHSTAHLAEMIQLGDNVTVNIDPFFEKAEKGLKGTAEPDRARWQRLHDLLTHLELMAVAIVSLEYPIREKIKDNIIFSDADVFYLNNLFSRQTGLLRTLEDVLHQDNASLKSYLLTEGRRVVDESFEAAANHETHTLESMGQPRAWSVYLSLVDRHREILKHLLHIVQTLS
ncbi:MAG: hypothetical protein FJ128_02045 [Deltaproteobacteria bacterium]|nr:hypothetical protein [Deltaproteobacteria bacterium]